MSSWGESIFISSLLCSRHSFFLGQYLLNNLQENGSHVALVAESKGADSDYCGETHSYHFSPSVIRSERELLKKYQVKDFRDLITDTHVLLVVKIMQSVHSYASVLNHVISSLDCLLEQASSFTLQMHNVYNKIELLPTQQNKLN